MSRHLEHPKVGMQVTFSDCWEGVGTGKIVELDKKNQIARIKVDGCKNLVTPVTFDYLWEYDPKDKVGIR